MTKRCRDEPTYTRLLVARKLLALPDANRFNIAYRKFQLLPLHQRIMVSDAAMLKGRPAHEHMDAILCYQSEQIINEENLKTRARWRKAALAFRVWRPFIIYYAEQAAIRTCAPGGIRRQEDIDGWAALYSV